MTTFCRRSPSRHIVPLLQLIEPAVDQGGILILLTELSLTAQQNYYAPLVS